MREPEGAAARMHSGTEGLQGTNELELLAVLACVAESLQSDDDLDAVLRTVSARCLASLAVDAALIFVGRPGSLVRHGIHHQEFEADGLRLAQIDEAMTTRRVTTEKLEPDSRFSGVRVIAPIVTGTAVHGAFLIETTSPALGTEWTHCASAFAGLLAGAITRRVALPAPSAPADLRVMLDGAADGALFVAHGRVLYVNPAMSRELGFSYEQIVGKCLTDLVTEADRERVSKLDARANDHVIRFLTRAGALATWELSPPQPLVLNGAAGELFIARDLSERTQRAAQLLVADRLTSMGSIAAGVAHEINNPLAAVLLNLELALEETRAPQTDVERNTRIVEELTDAREAALRVQQIVQDLRLFTTSRDNEIRSVDLHQVLGSTMRVVAPQIRKRAMLKTALTAVPAVSANESRLGQVFLALLVNASQAIPTGAPHQHSVFVTTRLHDDEHVAIEIVDTGVGVPLEIQRRLFTPFLTTRAAGEGAGLGLSLCQRMVSEIGGRIEIETEVGKGTTVRVLLRRAT